MNKYLAAFAYLLAGAFLNAASWSAGFGTLLTSGLTGLGSSFILFLAVNLLGLYLLVAGAWFYLVEGWQWIKAQLKNLSKL